MTDEPSKEALSAASRAMDAWEAYDVDGCDWDKLLVFFALAIDKAVAEGCHNARQWAYEQRLTKFRSGCACHIDPDTDKLVNVCELHKDQVEQARAEEREECALAAKLLKGWGVVGVGAAAVAEHIADAIRNRADRT